MNYKLSDLATVFNDLLGAEYNIDVNCNLKVVSDKTEGIMSATRRPFALSGINAESVELSFQFYTSVRQEIDKLTSLEELAVIIGHHSGTFTSNTVSYKYHSYIDFNNPTSAPVINMGDYEQVIMLSGTCLISDAESGAIIGNDLTTELYTYDAGTATTPATGGETDVGGALSVLGIQTSYSTNAEGITFLNSEKMITRTYAHSVTYSLNCVFLKTVIDAYLITYIQSASILGKAFWIRRILTSGITCKPVILVNAAITEEAGAYVSYSLTLSDRG